MISQTDNKARPLVLSMNLNNCLVQRSFMVMVPKSGSVPFFAGERLELFQGDTAGGGLRQFGIAEILSLAIVKIDEMDEMVLRLVTGYGQPEAENHLRLLYPKAFQRSMAPSFYMLMLSKVDNYFERVEAPQFKTGKVMRPTPQLRRKSPQGDGTQISMFG